MIQIKAVLKNGTIFMGEVLSYTKEDSFENVQIKIRSFSIVEEPTAVEQAAYVTFVKVKDCKKIVIRNKEERHDTANEGQDITD
jgi:hypothetical protein